MTRTVSTSGCWIIALGVLLSMWTQPLGAQEVSAHGVGAQEDPYPALGFTLPASSVQEVSPGLRGESESSAQRLSSASAGKLRGVQVASTYSAFTPDPSPPDLRSPQHPHPQVDVFPTAVPQLPISRTASTAPQIPYTPQRQTSVVPQPALPPPDFTGSRPPVGASPRGLWLVNQFLGELPVDLQSSPPPALEPAATLAAGSVAAANRPLGPHRLASHQQPSDPPAPSPPPLEPIPTQEPLIAPVPTPSNEPPAGVEIVAGAPSAQSYQPVLWPNYLESRLIPSFPPCCQPICRPCRPPIPACCPCR